MNLVNSVGSSVSGVHLDGGKGGFSGSGSRGDNGASSGNYGSRDGNRGGSMESSIGKSITISGSGKAIGKSSS